MWLYQIVMIVVFHLYEGTLAELMMCSNVMEWFRNEGGGIV